MSLTPTPETETLTPDIIEKLRPIYAQLDEQDKIIKVATLSNLWCVQQSVSIGTKLKGKPAKAKAKAKANHKHKKKAITHKVPNYINDLNAIKEAEDTLSSSDKKVYNNWLLVIVPQTTYIWEATAEQRAEAFVLTMEKTK